MEYTGYCAVSDADIPKIMAVLSAKNVNLLTAGLNGTRNGRQIKLIELSLNSVSGKTTWYVHSSVCRLCGIETTEQKKQEYLVRLDDADSLREKRKLAALQEKKKKTELKKLNDALQTSLDEWG